MNHIQFNVKKSEWDRRTASHLIGSYVRILTLAKCKFIIRYDEKDELTDIVNIDYIIENNESTKDLQQKLDDVYKGPNMQYLSWNDITTGLSAKAAGHMTYKHYYNTILYLEDIDRPEYEVVKKNLTDQKFTKYQDLFDYLETEVFQDYSEEDIL